MLNLWLNIALAIELFLKSRGSRRRVVLLVVAVFTTMSVTGILFLLLCLLLYLPRSERGSKAGRVGMMMAVILLLALPVLVILIGFSLSLKADTRSYLMRLSDYSAGVKLWLDYPILGSGYGNLRSLQEYMYSPDGVLGFSNSLTAVLGTGGLWVAVLFYIPHFGSISVRWSGDRDYARFCICYAFLFCTTAYFCRFIAVVMIAFQVALLLGKRGRRRGDAS